MEFIDTNIDIKTIIITLQAIALIILAIINYKSTKKQSSTYECDRLHLELSKILLSDYSLMDLYNVGPKKEKERWESFTNEEKKLYVFCEMNYFHFAFVFREYKNGRVDEGYWSIYEEWLINLINYFPLFEIVYHENKNYFETEFAKKVGLIIYQKNCSQ